MVSHTIANPVNHRQKHTLGETSLTHHLGQFPIRKNPSKGCAGSSMYKIQVKTEKSLVSELPFPPFSPLSPDARQALISLTQPRGGRIGAPLIQEGEVPVAPAELARGVSEVTCMPPPAASDAASTK